MIKGVLIQDFYQAVLNQNEQLISKAVSELRVGLIRFLAVTMRANQDDAEDAVQNVFFYTINNIRSGNIQDPKKLGSYLIRATKNHYLSVIRKSEMDELNTNIEYIASLDDQIDSLVEEEKKEALSYCVDNLEEKNRSFITYWLLKPDEKADTMAKTFELSVSNVFTKKHRLIKILSDCVKKRLSR